MSKHWPQSTIVPPDSRRRQRGQGAPIADKRLMLLCAAALFGVAIAIGESLLR